MRKIACRRIVVDLVPNVTGGGRTLGLSFAGLLRDVRPQHKFLACASAGYGYEEVCGQSGVETRLFRRGFGYSVWRLWYDQVILGRIVREWRADALLSMGNIGPLFPGASHAILVHNFYLLEPWNRVAGLLTAKERLSIGIQRFILKRLLTPDRVLIVQTPVMAARLQEMASDGSQIAGNLRLAPNCIPPEAIAFEGSQDQELTNRITSAARGRFRALTLAHYYPHKNLERVVNVAARLENEAPERFVYFITITPDQHPGARRVLKEIRRRGLEDVVINVGSVPRRQLGALYRSVNAVLFPTLLESFSSTYVEAMYFRKPIITSDRDFARYVCGDAALYVDPESTDACVNALTTLANSDSLSSALVAEGERQLASFSTSWRDVAEMLLESVEEACDRSESRCPVV